MSDGIDKAQIVSVAEALGRSRHTVALTGAGMSQESGIPTFRDAQTGMWAKFRPEELATEAAFRRNPPRVFTWYLQRLVDIRAAVPNAGHEALARLEARIGHLTVATQNIDGLHRRAGSSKVFELHGSIERFKCIDNSHPYDVSRLAPLTARAQHETVTPPKCDHCGSFIRPDVVWFGELLPEAAVEGCWISARSCDVMLVIGTSAQVYPAAELPMIASSHGALVVEINPEPTSLTDFVAYSLRGTAAMLVPMFEQHMRTE